MHGLVLDLAVGPQQPQAERAVEKQQALDFAYSGTYELPDKRTIKVRGVGTNWSIQVQGKFPEPIEPISPTEAISPTRELEVEFDLGANGVATGLTVREGSTSQDATRL